MLADCSLASQFEWAWQKAEISRHLRRPRPAGLPAKEKSLSYFPTRSINGSPLAKIAILQRLLVCLPFSRLTLSVQLFSLESQSWWEIYPTTASATAGPAKKKVSVKAIADSVREMQIHQHYGPAERPDLSNVKRLTRVQGVDGERLMREGTQSEEGAEGIKGIEVDDGLWTDEHLQKWDALAETSMDNAQCTLCRKEVDTSKHLDFFFCHASPACQSIVHLSCLAKAFLSKEASSRSSTAIAPPLIPDQGTCPSCSTSIRWGDVIRGCYRRHVNEEDGGAARALRAKRRMRAQKVLDKKLAEEMESSEEAELDEDGQPVKKTRKKRTKKVAPLDAGAEAGSAAVKAVKAKGTRKKKAYEAQSDDADTVMATKKPAKAKTTKAVSGTAKPPKGKATGKTVKAGSSVQPLPETDSASGSEATERFDFLSDEDPKVAATIVKRARKKATSESATSDKVAASTKGKGKGKAKATLSPLSGLSEASEDESSRKSRKAQASKQQLSLPLDCSADEATDEERSLAYAAAAEGSMEMQRLDMDDDSPDGFDRLSKSSHSPSSSKDLRQSDAEPPSPTKKRRTSASKQQVVEPDMPQAASESQKTRRPRNAWTTSPKTSRSKQANAAAAKPIQIVEISD